MLLARFVLGLNRKVMETNLAKMNDASTGQEKTIYSLDDIGNAVMLASIFQNRIRYCEDLRSWLVWDGKHLAKNDVTLWRHARLIVRIRFHQAKSKYNLVTTNGIVVSKEDVLKWAIKSASKARMQAMLDVASILPQMATKLKELDKDEYLFNCQNGTIDLRTGELRKHSLSDMLTHISDVSYRPDAPCPEWLKFVEDITLGNWHLQEYLQEVLGYCLCGSVSEQIMFVLVGKGANGKSTFLNAFINVLGTYAKTTPAHTFVKSESRALRNDLARLVGARFVSAVEINSGKKLDEALVKGLAGGDRVAARFIGKEFFEYTPQAKFFLAVNVFPEVSGADDGIYRRLRVIPFDAAFAPHQMDKDKPAKLKKEAEGILAWAVEGFKRWYERKSLLEPEVVTEASMAFREQMDAVRSFIDDYCILDPGASVQVGSLYDAYIEWAKQNALEPMSKKQFGTHVGQKGFTQGKSGKTRSWKGLKFIVMP